MPLVLDKLGLALLYIQYKMGVSKLGSDNDSSLLRFEFLVIN